MLHSRNTQSNASARSDDGLTRLFLLLAEDANQQGDRRFANHFLEIARELLDSDQPASVDSTAQALSARMSTIDS